MIGDLENDSMSDEERALTLVAIDAAYAAQIGRVFAVFCSATNAEFKSEAADRFAAELRRALDARAMAMAEVTG
jgi:DNA-binding IclR family transcriptional regulator